MEGPDAGSGRGVYHGIRVGSISEGRSSFTAALQLGTPWKILSFEARALGWKVRA